MEAYTHGQKKKKKKKKNLVVLFIKSEMVRFQS